MVSLFYLAILASAVWVFFDARQITEQKRLPEGPMEQSPLVWAIAVALLWIVCFPLYLVQRGKVLAAPVYTPPAGGMRRKKQRNPLLFALAVILLLGGGLVLLGNALAGLRGGVDWSLLLGGAAAAAVGVWILMASGR